MRRDDYETTTVDGAAARAVGDAEPDWAAPEYDYGPYAGDGPDDRPDPDDDGPACRCRDPGCPCGGRKREGQP